jgi:hypothetical protein
MGSLRLFLRLLPGVLLCLHVAGCAPEPEATPGPTTGESVSKSPPPSVNLRSLAPDVAKSELEELIERIEGLKDPGNKSWPGLGFYGASGQVTQIHLRAEFGYSCDCCTSFVCSQVADDDIAFFGSFESLEVLTAPKSALRGHGLAALRDLKHLRTLDLSLSPIQDDTLVHLANLPSLETLRLDDTNINGQGLRHLVDLPSLSRLSILGCRLSADGWQALGSLTQLRHLEVVATEIDGQDQHLRHLANLQNLVTLETGNYASKLTEELAEWDRLLHFVGDLPYLRRISHYSQQWLTLAGLRHFKDAPPLESIGSTVRIVPEPEDPTTAPSPRETLQRFDALKSLQVYVDCSASADPSNRRVEICNMDSLESLTVRMPEQGAECYLHDLPNLRELTLLCSSQSLYDSRGTRDPADPHFERVRLEKLPRLRSLLMPIPREFIAQDVATQPEPDPEGTREKKRPGLHATLYGLLTESVARDLASIDGLVRLELNPQLGSAPAALEAFREHPTFCELGMRFNDSPRDWIQQISTLHETLKVLELPSQDLFPHQDKPDLPLDTETLAPLARMTNLETLRIRNVVDPDGEPLTWVSDLPLLVDFRLLHYDLERFHIRFTNERAIWSMGSPGRIGTVEVSQWPQTSTNVILDSRFDPCNIAIRGEVNHYVIRDIPHATFLKLDTEKVETVRLAGDLSELTKVRDHHRKTEWIVAPAASIPPSLQLPRQTPRILNRGG